MSTGVATRLVLTLLALACTAWSIVVEPGQFPFGWHVVDAHTLGVHPSPGRAMPPGLAAGDRLDLGQQDLRTRASLYASRPAGETYVLQVRRGDSTISVPVTTVASDDTGISRLFDVTLVLVLVLGLTTLWWGRDWAAWGLSLFALATVLNFFLYLMPFPSPVAATLAVLLNQGLVGALLPAGLYVSALALAGPTVRGRPRAALHGFFVSVVLATVVVLLVDGGGYILFGRTLESLSGIAGLLFAVAILTPIALLVAALARADAARRLRLRWTLVSLALFIGAIAWNNLGQLGDAFSTRGLVRQVIWWAALLSGLAGLLYAVLRKRVVAMSFAVNRALVYGIVAALVIGVFGALTVVLENTAIGEQAGFAVTVGVSLAIGFVLEALRDRINVVVERLFFRRRYEAETALRRFARECAFIENADRLLDEAQAEIHRHIRPGASAIYDATEAGYLCVRRHGDFDWPEHIEVDDRAFVSMRASREPVELAGITSALGKEGWAFPMAVRGVLEGALVCGARTEQYTADERRLVAEVAQQVGIALHALRARDNEALVRALASGEIDLATARRRAGAALGMS